MAELAEGLSLALELHDAGGAVPSEVDGLLRAWELRPPRGDVSGMPQGAAAA
jgi:hypothetical protein